MRESLIKTVAMIGIVDGERRRGELREGYDQVVGAVARLKVSDHFIHFLEFGRFLESW
jgi:hypothetical protein